MRGRSPQQGQVLYCMRIPETSSCCFPSLERFLSVTIQMNESRKIHNFFFNCPAVDIKLSLALLGFDQVILTPSFHHLLPSFLTSDGDLFSSTLFLFFYPHVVSPPLLLSSFILFFPLPLPLLCVSPPPLPLAAMLCPCRFR